MTFAKKALGILLSLSVALTAPAAALAQTERAPVIPAAPTTLAVPLSLPVLPALAPQAASLPRLAPAFPGASAAAAAPASVATEKPAAVASLRAAALSARPAAAPSPAQDAARLDGFWSGRRGTAAAAVISAAPGILGRAGQALGKAKPYVAAGAVLVGTYALHRAARWGIDRLAAKRGWDPERVDNLHFIGTVVSWTLGAGVGIHLAGAATTKVVAALGLALSFAIKNSVSNVLQAVLFLARRPFLMGEKVRIDDKLYQVEDMQAQYVKLRLLARLLEDAPAKTPAGFAVVPMAQIDPLGREVNEKGHKFAQVRDASAGQVEYERWSYTLLAGKPLALYRPYVDKRTLAALRGLPSRLASERWRASVSGVVAALRETPRKKLVRAALWVGAAAALTPLWPLLQAHLTFLGVQALFPYAQGGILFLATRMVSSFADDFLPILAKKLGWSRQLFVVIKLLTQAGIFLTGMSGALRALGLEWSSVLTSLGVPAAAMAFASGDILQSLTSGIMLRMSRSVKIGEFYGMGTTGPSGVIQEMNFFHLVLKPAEGMHVLVPYNAVSDNPQRTLESEPGAQP